MDNTSNNIINILDNKYSNLSEDLVHSTRLLSWINNSDYKTHPVASLTSLLTIISAITARSHYGQTRASTTLYLILIAKTGIGKNGVLNASNKIMNLIDQDDKIITGKINSEGAFDDVIKDQGVAIQIIDEFGDQLGHMLNDKGGYLQVVAAKYKTLYSSTSGIYKPNRYSTSGGKQKIDVSWKKERPCFGITGLTTEAQLLNVIGVNQVHDGFLNRFIFLDGNNIKPTFNDNPQFNVPRDIIEHINSINMCRNTNDINDDSYKIIPFSSEASKYYHKEIGDADIRNSDIYNYCQDDLNETKRAISIRWRENALRLATAFTAYEKHKEISLNILKLSYRLVKDSSINFLNTFNEKAAETKYSILKDKAIAWFGNNKTKDNITKSHLARNAHVFKNLKPKDRNELLEDLVDIGLIVKYQNSSNNTCYKIAS